MRILAVDTAGAFGSIALVEDGLLLHETNLHAPEGFGSVLFDQIGQILALAGWRIGQIDVFAGGTGPGSFTGIRVGLSVVKGLAASLDRPAAGISNLQALAAKGSASLRATVLDARRGEIYGAVYDAQLQPVRPELVTPVPAWLMSLPDGDLEFVAADFAPFRGALAGTAWEAARVLDGRRFLAGVMGEIAFRRAQAGQLVSAAEIDANYVRRADAELFWKEA